MPRRSRINLADVPQHIIQQGNNRQATFFAEEDYQCYLGWLVDAAKKYDCRIYAYVLMTNHVHLLVSSARAYGLSLMMQYVGRYFVRYINRVYRRTGTLWEGRFKASLVDAETYFLRCCRYIECNPVRAQMVFGPGEYAWSSYRNHAFGPPDRLLAMHEEYERLEARTKNASGRIANCSVPSSMQRSSLRSEIRPTEDGHWEAIDSKTRSSVRCNVRLARPSGAGRQKERPRCPLPSNEGRSIESKSYTDPIYLLTLFT